MTEKVGLIKNPLTIIAIFAGIAEVSGTIVLPFIASMNQELFIYFLIFFPSILVILFFITLNFNNKVLYAPSDYTDENNYIKINRYDKIEQKNIEVKVRKENLETIHLQQKIEKFETQISQLRNELQNLNIKSETLQKDLESEKTVQENKVQVTNFINAGSFISYMSKKGIDVDIYLSPKEAEQENSLPEHEAIWLGQNVSLEFAQLVLRHSKTFYPHLKYVLLDKDVDAEDDIYVGGASEAAKRMKLIPLKNSDFGKIQTFEKIEQLHNFLSDFQK